jgi:hypothetical protein
MTRAFIARLAPSIQFSEVDAMANDPKNLIHNLNSDPRYEQLRDLTLQPDRQHAFPWHRSWNNDIHSVHFWLYSLFVVPFLLFAMLAGFSDTMAFLWANLFSASAAIVAILMFHRGSRANRFILVLTFLCAGTVYYLRWNHPEVFTASLLMIGLLLLRREHMKSAAVLFALAGQQNPPILLLLPIVFLMDFVRLKVAQFACWKKSALARISIGAITGLAIGFSLFVHLKATRFVRWKKSALAWIGIGAIAGLSIGFSLYEFGVPNLISLHATDKNMVSAARVLSLYFNPNFGGFYAAPLLLVGIVALPFCFWRERQTHGANIRWALLFALMSIILAIPSTITGNFNPGMKIVHRYSYWILVPVIMLLGEMMQSILLQRKALLAGLAAGQILVTCGLYSNGANFVHFSTAELILLDHFPRLYNPIPEIFVERGSTQENFHGSYPNDFHLWVYHGEIRKILFHGKDKIASFPKCLDQHDLKDYVVSRKKVENGWRYWNLRKGCRTNLMNGYVRSASITHE